MYTNWTKYIWLTTTFHLTLMMTSAQVVETSVTTTDNSPSQDYTHPDDQTTLLHVTPVFKPFTVKNCLYRNDEDILLYYDKTIIDVSLKCQSKHVLDSKECKSWFDANMYLRYPPGLKVLWKTGPQGSYGLFMKIKQFTITAKRKRGYPASNMVKHLCICKIV